MIKFLFLSIFSTISLAVCKFYFAIQIPMIVVFLPIILYSAFVLFAFCVVLVLGIYLFKHAKKNLKSLFNFIKNLGG